MVSTACAGGVFNERRSPPRHSLGLMNKKLNQTRYSKNANPLQTSATATPSPSRLLSADMQEGSLSAHRSQSSPDTYMCALRKQAKLTPEEAAVFIGPRQPDKKRKRKTAIRKKGPERAVHNAQEEE